MREDIGLLRTAIPYIRAFKGKVFVVKLGGQLCDPGAALDGLVEQLSLLYQLGIKLIVVHGGGMQATALSERLGVNTPFVNGRRVTSADALEVAKMAFAGVINTNLLASFRRNAVPAVGLSGVDGAFITAKRRPVTALKDMATGETREVDFGFVGDIVQTDVALLRDLLEGGYVPVISSLAADEQGQVLNVNADTVASTTAIALSAAKYVLLTTVDGVMRDVNDHSTLLSYLDLSDVEALINDGVIAGGMLPKLQACLSALRSGVARVHIINGLEPDSLLEEVFTNEGCGTLIVAKREAKPLAPTFPFGAGK